MSDHIVTFLASMGEPEMAEEVLSMHNRLEAFANGLDRAANDFDAKRLRRLAVLLGLSVPESDETLIGCAGTVLGQACRAVEKIFASAPQPPAVSAEPDAEVVGRIRNALYEVKTLCYDLPVGAKLYLAPPSADAKDAALLHAAIRKVLQHHKLTVHGDGVVEADLISAMQKGGVK